MGNALCAKIGPTLLQSAPRPDFYTGFNCRVFMFIIFTLYYACLVKSYAKKISFQTIMRKRDMKKVQITQSFCQSDVRFCGENPER